MRRRLLEALLRPGASDHRLTITYLRALATEDLDDVKSSYVELMEELRRLRSAPSGEKG
ncbi:MAG: hypothetical protein NZ733_04800 [Aigarchaeota archaeon]|nr:hypothetical protein [Aigarchaeota archaeon]MCX8203900.1 hypothetical protein [Nitrososphaeria archaeon]MDW8043775.1 hypothetical protein [Nitrososphaerota archaeon]